MKNKNITTNRPAKTQWQKKIIKERLKKSEKGGKFLTNIQVEKIVKSFKP